MADVKEFTVTVVTTHTRYIKVAAPDVDAAAAVVAGYSDARINVTPVVNISSPKIVNVEESAAVTAAEATAPAE